MPKIQKTIQEIINFYELPEIKEVQYKHENPNFNWTQMKIPFGVLLLELLALLRVIPLRIQHKNLVLGICTISHIHIFLKLEED